MFAYFPIKIRNVFYYRFLWKAGFPEIIHIENTNACNANCLICAREKMTRPIGFMDFPLFKKIINECSMHRGTIREVHLHGYGEPLLDRMIFDKIRYAKSKGIKKVYFVTNASLLKSDVARALIYSGLDRIKFSFYGMTKETYEKIHIGLKFEEAEENVRNFLTIRKQKKSRNPSVNIQFVPQNDNLREKDIFFNKWDKLIDRKSGDCIEEFYLHNWIYGRDYNPKGKETVDLRSCVIPFYLIQILWNGDVVPCVFDFNGKMPMGEIRTKSIKEVWRDKRYKLLRGYHRRRKFDKTISCYQCDQLKTKNGLL